MRTAQAQIAKEREAAQGDGSAEAGAGSDEEGDGEGEDGTAGEGPKSPGGLESVNKSAAAKAGTPDGDPGATETGEQGGVGGVHRLAVPLARREIRRERLARPVRVGLQIDREDVPAVLDEALGDRTADPARRPGDDGDLPVQRELREAHVHGAATSGPRSPCDVFTTTGPPDLRLVQIPRDGVDDRGGLVDALELDRDPARRLHAARDLLDGDDLTVAADLGADSDR